MYHGIKRLNFRGSSWRKTWPKVIEMQFTYPAAFWPSLQHLKTVYASSKRLYRLAFDHVAPWWAAESYLRDNLCGLCIKSFAFFSNVNRWNFIENYTSRARVRVRGYECSERNGDSKRWVRRCYNLWRQVLDECFAVRACSVVKPQILPIFTKI